jgi:hypothetical protein
VGSPARYDRKTLLGRAELARHVIRRTATTVDERYGLLAYVLWGDESHEIGGLVALAAPTELERQLVSPTQTFGRTCAGINRHGYECRRPPRPGSDFCWSHREQAGAAA